MEATEIIIPETVIDTLDETLTESVESEPVTEPEETENEDIFPDDVDIDMSNPSDSVESPYLYTVDDNLHAQYVELLQQQVETQTLLLQSSQRQEKQLEACISVLLIIIVVGALNYIYKLFKMFF